jgi:hypothetical protein
VTSEEFMPVNEPVLDLDGTSSEGLDLAETPDRSGTLFEGQPAPAPGTTPPQARSPRTAHDTQEYMPVDEPVLDLGATSSEGLDLQEAPRARGTMFEGGPAVDAREMEFGQEAEQAGQGFSDEKMPSGIFDTSEVALATEPVQGGRMPTGVLETTPWEPAPNGGPGLQPTPYEEPPAGPGEPGLQPTGWEPPPGDPRSGPPGIQSTPWEQAPSTSPPGDPGLQPTPYEEPPQTPAPPVDRFQGSGAREVDLSGADVGEAPPQAPDTGQAPTPYAPLEVQGGDVDLELAVDPVRTPEGAGTVFDGAVPDVAASAPAPEPVPGLDLTQQGVDPSLISSDQLPPPSGTYPGLEEGQVRVTAVADVFKQIDKAVKALNLYEGQESQESPRHLVQNAYNRLVEVMNSFGAIDLAVTPYEFLMDERSVYTTDEERRGITYRLFRDGVRELSLLPSLTREEFEDLLHILRAVQHHGGEEDTVTLLWGRSFAGVRYQAVDFFLEGMIVSESESFQAHIEKLMEVPGQPLHRSNQPSQVARQVMSQVTQPLVQQAQQQRAGGAAALLALDDGARLAAVAVDDEVLTTDLWRRGMHILVRMMDHGKASAIAGILVRIIQQLMMERRWKMLGASTQALADVMRGKQLSSEAANSLQAALRHLCEGNRLLSFQGMLAGCTLFEYHQLAALLQILPREADSQLLALCTRMPAGEVQDQLIQLLKQRGVDMTAFLAQRLQSNNLMHVLAAIADLRKLGTKPAVQAIRKTTTHPNPRVRLEALRALAEFLDVSFAPQLISALGVGHRDLRDLALTLLERLQPDRDLAPHLVHCARQDSFDDWGAEHRSRLLKLLIRWGGKECNEFAIKSVTALNPLRRKRIETLRMEMIRALGETGGKRATKLLKACLEYRPSKGVRSAIELALRQAEQLS